MTNGYALLVKELLKIKKDYFISNLMYFNQQWQINVPTIPIRDFYT